MNELREGSAELKARAAKYVADGSYNKAIEAYEKILKIQPEDPDILNLVGDTYRKLGKRGKAVEMFEKSVKIYSRQAIYDNAVAICKKILRIEPNRSGVIKTLAKLYVQQGLTGQATSFLVDYAMKKKGEGNYEAVLDAYKYLITIRPKDVGLRMKLADEYIGTGRMGDACIQLQEIAILYREEGNDEEVANIEKLIQEVSTPEEARIREHWERVQGDEGSGSVEQAVGYYYKAAEQSLNQIAYHLAKDLFLKIVELKPEELKAWQRLIQIANSLNDKKGAIRTYLSLAKALIQKNAVDSATSIYNKILLLEPDNEEAKNALTSLDKEKAVYVETPGSEEETAEKTGERTVEQPTGETVEQAVGETVEQPVGETVEQPTEGTVDKPVFKVEEETMPSQPIPLDELLSEFERGVEQYIGKGDYATYYDLGVSFKEMGKFDEAINHLKKAAEGTKEKLKAYELLGRCYIEKGDFETAVDYLKKGLSIDGFNQNEYLGLRFNLAIAYEATGRIDEALKECKIIESKDPQYFDIAQRIKKLESMASVTERPDAEKPAKDRRDDKISYI